jgi:hypothetical protein
MNAKSPDRVQDTLAASSMLLPATKGNGIIPAGHDGNLLTRLVNQEERRHFNVQQVVEHVSTELLQAQQAMGLIATDGFAVGMEFEAQAEQIIEEYKDSQLAMSAAPAYLSMSRQHLMQGLATVGEAGLGHISRKIARR